MPPIPVHTSSPINSNAPSHASGTSPSTAAARYAPANADASPTTKSSRPYPQARPGAPAVPQPTNAASSTHNNRFQPTATTATPTTTSNSSGNPPPPQPGAVPSPYYNEAPKVTVPQAPQPGDVPQWTAPQWTSSITSPVRHNLPTATPTRTQPVPLPAHQQSPSLYLPNGTIPPASVTSTHPYDLSHPPGYRQDTRASFDDKPIEQCVPYERPSPSSYSRKGGILDGEPIFGRVGDNETVVDTAMSWVKAAGKRLSSTEQEIWKHINGMGKS
ncbi:hypothetical protein PV11_06534 [Exophiala sideris]|uniref:Uncharacterized protein n=1 Tax=Exophiala sideris TaxID=1016849 RepID=A0A0D1VS67_9EURO|nr:hypothetical protein PV11_06534 [Exophiala sideris]